MSNQRIQQVGIPVNNSDAARKIDVDNIKDYADSTFINKNAGVTWFLYPEIRCTSTSL